MIRKDEDLQEEVTTLEIDSELTQEELQEEDEKDKRRLIIIIIISLLFLIVMCIYMSFSLFPRRACTLNCDLDGDGIYDIYVDIDGDGVCDINCIIIGEDGKEYMINIDYNNDRVARWNLDTDGDGIPDINLVNKDINSDGKCDFNCDIDGDGKPDINLDFDNTNVCYLNCDTNNDNKADTNVDTDGDGKCDVNCINNNPDLKTLTVDGYDLYPDFNSNTTFYKVKVPEGLNFVNISAEAVNANAKIEGIGRIDLPNASNNIVITVTAIDGTKKNYTIVIDKVSTTIPEEPIKNYFLQVDFYKQLVAYDILPGFEDSHAFRVKNNSTRSLIYNINLKEVLNTVEGNDFQYRIIKDGKVIKDWAVVPKTNGIIYSNILIGAGEINDIVIEYRFLETNENQSIDMNKTFSADVEVLFDDSRIMNR